MCMPGTALSRYINIYTDFAFKKVFGTEANKDLLISFLNQLMGLTGDSEITDVTYLNPEQLGDNINERRAVYDVYCSTGNGEHFIVEMQKAKQDHFKDRALYYSSFAIREQGTKGSILKPWDYKLMPVYVVGILNFVMDEEDEEVITRVTLKDDRNREFNKNLQFIFIEMPKFTKEETELKTFLDKWLYVIKNISRLDDKPQALTEGIFKKLFDVAEISQFSKVDRAEYEESLKVFWDFSNVLSTAERKGRAEGEAIGIAKGERDEKLHNAKKMKQKGLSSEDIAEITGLSKEEIENL